MLGSCVEVINVLEKLGQTESKKGEIMKVPIPIKLVTMHEALEENFDWIVPANPFDECSKPKSNEKGISETHIDKIQCILERISCTDLDASSILNTRVLLSVLSSKALNKSAYVRQPTFFIPVILFS